MVEVPRYLTNRRERNTNVPQLPPVAQACLELIQKPNADIDAVAQMLAAEPDSETRIITLANCGLFAGQRHSANLQQALTNLGTRQALILNVACEVFAAIRTLPAGDIDIDAFAQRACIAAAWGRTFGSEFGRPDSAELLLAAMIQDVGILLIAESAPDTYTHLEPLATDRRELARLENAALDADHRRAGAWLATTWQLPDDVTQHLRLGHDLAAEDIPRQQLGFYRAVNFCGDLAEVWCRPLTAQIVACIAADGQRYLGISADRLADLFRKVAVQVAYLAPILDLECPATEFESTARQVQALLPTSNIRTLSVHVSRGVYAPTNASNEATANLVDATGFAMRLDEEFALASRHGWPLSLLLVEIDDFNDLQSRYGNKGGEQLHENIATLLGHGLRSGDFITSVADGHLAILLPGSDTDTAAPVAKRLVNEARKHVSPDETADNFAVTVSLGVATLNQDAAFANTAELRAAATAALEHSLQSGRDRHTTYASIRAA